MYKYFIMLLFDCIFAQIHVALVSIRDFFQKHKKIWPTPNFWMIVSLNRIITSKLYADLFIYYSFTLELSEEQKIIVNNEYHELRSVFRKQIVTVL